MNAQETDWQDGETLLTPARRQDDPSTTEPVPALTILAHTDTQRVGDRLALPALAAGLEVRLSRTEPVFDSPGGTPERASGPRALEERHLSRRPLRLVGGEEPGTLVLERDTVRTSVVADGQPLGERRVFSTTEVEHGVVLELGHRVVLLLHLLPTPVPEEAPGFGLVGESVEVVRLRRELRRLATLDVPVLLCGETGTGKELSARALHDASPRRGRPYVTVNMATLPATLAAAELFGAERGAYTGAEHKKAGLFLQADGGTLFLDEIGETPSEVQPMLLRVLESREIRPLGSGKPTTVDVRIVAATDADLETALATGSFRAPLYHRLAASTVRLPPLRRRRDDIGRLLYHFLADELSRLDQGSSTNDDGRPWPPAELVARLVRHGWPGNVRELRNVVRWLVLNGRDIARDLLVTRVEEALATPAQPESPPAIADTSATETSVAPAASTTPAPPPRRRLRKMSEVGEDELLAALEAHHFEIKPTAEALGLSRINLYRLIDSCSAIRKAAELGRAEVGAALARSDGDPVAAAAVLRVSLQGLKRQITALGLGRRRGPG